MKRTTPNRPQRNPQSFEPLERRMMLNGDVTAILKRGDLIIRGDIEDNQVMISQPAPGTVRIEGLDETSINGGEFVEFPLFTRDLLIQMQQGGEDRVAIQGEFNAADDVLAKLKAGEFLIEGSNGAVNIGGGLNVQAGNTGLVTIRNNVLVGDEVTIKAGEVHLVSGLATVPDFDSTQFDDSLNIDNPYFPLVVGTVYTYEGEELDEDTGELIVEDIVVEVLTETRTILGVQIRVVRDTVSVDGVLIEDTFDFFAQNNNGNVWYMGEEVVNYEYDEDGNLLGTNDDGSWEAGVDGAVPGIIMEAAPRIGHRYYQEFNADDVLDQAVGIGEDETITVPVGTFNGVYRTEEITVMDPFAVANKLYAPGLGTILEEDIDIEDNEVIKTTRLVSVELNGNPVTQVVSPTGFAGTNVGGTLVGGIAIGDKLNIRAKGAVIAINAEIDGALNVSAGEEIVVVDSSVAKKSVLFSNDTISLRGVEAAGQVCVNGNPDDVYILGSDIARFKVIFGRQDNSLVVEDSVIDKLEADGGKGANTFEDVGGNVFGKLKLKRFTSI